MYNGIKSCISVNNNTSGFFTCARGLRQGENLSPLLFSLYLNDVEHYIMSRNNACIELIDDEIDMFLKLVIILYADDTVLFAHNEHDLMSLLQTFNEYCFLWKLDINYDKTKVLVFGDKFGRNRNISVNNQPLEVVDTFKYLGVLFSKNRNFTAAKKHICEQARKALFSLFRIIRNLDIPVDCQVKLFDSTILPILTYGCEVWGYTDVGLIEKVHTDFMKFILNVKSSTPHIMIYGDFGRYPLIISIKKEL